jgi:hypothetical protein
LDERTVAAWRDRAGRQYEKVHKAMIEQGKLDLKHAQIDEIRAKAKGSVLWIELEIMVKTRLWIAGKVSKTRDRNLADQLLQQVYLVGSVYNFCTAHHELSKSTTEWGFG